MQLIDSRRPFGKSVGWIDAHLLTASLLSSVPLWTLDRRLAELV
jgi:hypothetical protein